MHRLADLLERGRSLRAGGDRRLEAARAAIRPDDIATIIYTSGTTGEPKGVVLAHRNLMQNVNVLPGLLQITHEDLFISLLPPWHIFERMVEYVAIAAGACQTYSCIRTLGADMASEKPTFMASVPRVWEGILGRVTANIAKEPAAKQRIFGVLLGASKRYTAASKILQGRDTLYSKPSPAARLVAVLRALLTVVLLAPVYAFAQKKFAAIRLRTGGRLRAAVSGGGALPPYVDEFFAAVGITLLEGYGLTETSPVLAARTFDRLVLGTVGLPIPGTEIRIVDEQGRDLPQGQKGIVLVPRRPGHGRLPQAPGGDREGALPRRLVQHRRSRPLHDPRRALADRPGQGDDRAARRGEHRAVADRGRAQGEPVPLADHGRRAGQEAPRGADRPELRRRARLARRPGRRRGGRPRRRSAGARRCTPS